MRFRTALSTVPLDGCLCSVRSSRRSGAQQWQRRCHGGSVPRCMQRCMLLVIVAVISCNVYRSVLAATPAAMRVAAPEAPTHVEGSRGAGSRIAGDTASAAAAAGVHRAEWEKAGREEFHNAGGRPARETPGPHSFWTTQGQLGEVGAQEEWRSAEGALRHDDGREHHAAGFEEEEARRGTGGRPTSEKTPTKRLRTAEHSALKSGGADRPAKWPGSPYATGGVRIEGREGREVEGQEGGREAGDKREMNMGRREGKKLVVAEAREKLEEQEKKPEGGLEKREEGGVADPSEKEKEEEREEDREKGEQKDAEMETGERRAEGEGQTVDGVADKNKDDGDQGLETHSLLEKEREIQDKMIQSVFMGPPHVGHRFCAFPDAPWCGEDTRQKEEKPLNRIPRVIQWMNPFVSSVFSLPFFGIPFMFPPSLSDERPGSVRPAGPCRLMFTLGSEVPSEDIRLYVVPSERRVGLAADRVWKRTEEGKDYYRVYGTERRMHAAATIAEGCMASEELVKAGLIGWSYAGTSNGSINILVTFPSEAHGAALAERKQVSEEALKRLLDGEGLEQLTPSEKCLLSGRTESECEQLKAEAGEKREKALSFSTLGYAEKEIRLPQFVYV